MFLNTHTYYSLRYGTLSVKQLVEQAKTLGIGAMAITDINNSSAVIDFVKEAKISGIKPIAGMEFRDDDTLLFIGIARNNEGFRELNDHMTAVSLGEKVLQKTAPPFNNVYVIYPFGSIPPAKLKENEFVGIKPSQANLLFGKENEAVVKKGVIMQPVTFSGEKDYYLHKNLRAIDNNLLLSRLTPEMYAAPDEHFLSPAGLLAPFERYPRIIKNTLNITNDCGIDFDFDTPKTKRTFTGSRYDDKLLLEKLAYDGLKYRYGNKKGVEERVRRELQIIDKLGFSAYFLIAWDIVRYGMSRGFYHVGRGSGANSIVAYCLKITDVDPVELNLYFERFINPKRTSPPDFDIDYSWKERDEIIDYIFKRYGKNHTALLGTSVTFRGKSIYRELGKVHGLPKSEIDALTSNPASEIDKNTINRNIHKLALLMQGFPNQRSIHAGGVLISEKPITCYTALDMPPKGFPTTQWDMYVAESIGFEKLDILSQRGIGHIKEAVEIIERNRNVRIDIHQVERFKNDKKVKSQLKRAETNGCFYIESPAMRGLLKKLQCDDYLTLVAASSIIRPGVARSGMMREYIYRFHNPEKFKYVHPVMEEQLSETYGIMVYQEDVLKVCHEFAGLDLADADILRRAMSGKYRGKDEFNRIADRFFEGCRRLGRSVKTAKEVWRQIESFAGYSFSKAHSASYAVESFQSLYLKAHFPLEFQTAVINNFGGFYHSWVYFNEAERLGAEIELPCINNSEYKTKLYGKKIYIGFVHVANLEKKTSEKIIAERLKNGNYKSLYDFVRRVEVGKEQIILLIRTGALRFTQKTKSELMWELHFLYGKKQNIASAPQLFDTEHKNFKLPELITNPIEDAYDEIELLGFPVTLSWFDMLQTKFRGEIFATQLNKYAGKTVKMVGNLVTIKYVKTVKNEFMNFATFIDAKGEMFDTVHFPVSLKKYPFRGHGLYLLLGKVVTEFGYASLEVMKMAKLNLCPDPRR
jgi:DNA polymerase-3 subunit alpha